MNNELVQLIGANLLQIKADASAIAVGIEIPPQSGEASGFGGFGSRMLEAVRGVNQQDQLAADKMSAVDSGASDDLVGAMLSSQQASLSFSMLMQARNKVMGAVEDLIKLPI